MKFTKWQYLLTFSVASLGAWSGIPSSAKQHIPGADLIDIGIALMFGGLYAIEKMLQQPRTLATYDPTQPPSENK